MARKDTKPEVQHYVPKLLLRGFVKKPPKKEQLFAFDKHTGRSFLTNIANVAAERNFYDYTSGTGDRELEGKLSELENHTRSAFKTLIEAEDLSVFSDEQKSWISIFLATQQLRTRQFRETIKVINRESAQHISRLGYNPRAVEGFELIETEADLKAASMVQFALSMGPFSHLMATKESFLVKTSEADPFWISDHPAVMHNYREFGAYGNIGLAVPGIQIYLPLTSTLLLALWCRTNVDKLRENLRIVQGEIDKLSVLGTLGRKIDRSTISQKINIWQSVIDDEQPVLGALENGRPVQASADNVTFYNHLQVVWSHRYVMSQKNQFDLIKRMISDNPKYKSGLMPEFN